MTGYEFHPEAATDLEDIWEFIADDNQVAANRVAEDILARVATLATFPHQGHWRPDFSSRALRFTLVHE